MAILANTRDKNDPPRQCTCGFRRFRQGKVRSSSTVTRSVLIDTGGGFGSTSFGTLFGSGSQGGWGDKEGTLRTIELSVVCQNCRRERSKTVVSKHVIFGGYFLENKIYIVASDVSSTGCLSVLFEKGSSISLESALSISHESMQPLVDDSFSGTLHDSPQSTPADTLLEAPVPLIPEDGTYTISVVDSCFGITIPLVSVTLESDVIVLEPSQADLNGLPEILIPRGWKSQPEATQLASGSQTSVPFDWCEQVLEYDARFATDPTAQGWTHNGAGSAGDFARIDGGVIRAQTGSSSYWTKTATLNEDPPSQAVMYAVFQPRGVSSGDGIAKGLDMTAQAVGSAGNFSGVRAAWHTGLKYPNLDTSGDTDAFSVLVSDEVGGSNKLSAWHYLYMTAGLGNDDLLTVLDSSIQTGNVTNTFTGGATTSGTPTLKAHFGDTQGTGIDMLLRNFVASSPGRFMRAWFRGFAPASTCTLRLSLVSDKQVGTSGTTARFKVRYGSLGSGADIYTIPSSEESITADFTQQNQIFVVPFTLQGLTAGAPMWFTVERDWSHGDDISKSTIHLINATVRIQ